MFVHIYYAKFIELLTNGTNVHTTKNVNGAKRNKIIVKMLATPHESMDSK